MTATCFDYSHTLHTIPTDENHQVTVRQIINAIDTWVESNLRAENGGLEINGNEIFWLDYAQGQDHRVLTYTGPLLRLGIRPGHTGGWILSAYVDGRSTPILSAKLWTLDAAQQLMTYLSRASVDCIA